MRGGSRAALALAGAAVVGLAAAPAPAAPKRPVPQRGWVVDRVRIENLSPGGFLGVAGQGDFRGVLDVVPAGGGVAVVNEVALDDYLQGVAEVPNGWPTEALRAQVIAARTFALHQVARAEPAAAGGAGAQLCATEACQRYVGLDKERQEDGARWVVAVESTRGQVLLYKGDPILAMYSSSNGGRSVAGGRPYLPSVNDPDSARGPYGHWEVRLGYGELASALALPGPVATVRRVGESVVLDWTRPGGAAGQTVVPVLAFRTQVNAALGPRAGLPRAVPSTQFSLHADDPSASAVLDGRGHGHGVGMSQFGVLGKANRGMRAGDILASYYGGIRPSTLPAEQLPATVRVGLDTGSRAVSVRGSGRFRIVDGSGAPVATAAGGTWRVVPAGKGKVRVVPPPGEDAVPAVESLVVERPSTVAAAGAARFRLTTAALAHVRVEGSRLPTPAATAPVLLEPGDASLPLPAFPGAGTYVVTVVADAGAGRVAMAPSRLRMRAAAGAETVTAGLAPVLPRPAAVAWILLVAVASALVRVEGGRRRARVAG